jgi:hypothetical protein
LSYQPGWRTEALAVGSESFVGAMSGRMRQRQLLEPEPGVGVWMLREEYEPDFGPKNRAMTHPEASEKEQAVDAMPLVVVRPGNAH